MFVRILEALGGQKIKFGLFTLYLAHPAVPMSFCFTSGSDCRLYALRWGYWLSRSISASITKIVPSGSINTFLGLMSVNSATIIDGPLIRCDVLMDDIKSYKFLS